MSYPPWLWPGKYRTLVPVGNGPPAGPGLPQRPCFQRAAAFKLLLMRAVLKITWAAAIVFWGPLLALGNAQAGENCYEKYLDNFPYYIPTARARMIAAAMAGDIPCAKEALDNVGSAAGFDSRDSILKDGLDLAVNGNQAGMVRFLFEQGADPGGIRAMLNVHTPEIAKMLLENGAILPRPLHYSDVRYPWRGAIVENNTTLMRYFLSLVELTNNERQALIFFVTQHHFSDSRQEFLKLLAGEIQDQNNDRAWKDWAIWSRCGWIPGKYWPDPKEEFLLETLSKSFESAKPVHKPFNDASPRLRKAYRYLKTARESPEKLRASSLDIEGASTPYYRMILKGALSPGAYASGAFAPNQEQALRTARHILSDGEATAGDLGRAEWLLRKAGVAFDSSLLDAVRLPAEQVKKQLFFIRGTNLINFSTVPNMMALKLTKAILGIPSEKQRAHLFESFLQYGVQRYADRPLFVSLTRLMVGKVPWAAETKRNTLKIMQEWVMDLPILHYEFALLMAELYGPVPANERVLQDAALLAHSVGVWSDFSFSRWLAQIRAFIHLRAGKAGAPLERGERDLLAGLLKYSLGQTEGTLASKDGPKLKIGAAGSHAASLVKLCRFIKSQENSETGAENAVLINAASRFLYFLKENLDQPRIWPEGFESAAAQPATLREEFQIQGLEFDIKAVETGCESIQMRKIEDEASLAAREEPKPNPAGN